MFSTTQGGDKPPPLLWDDRGARTLVWGHAATRLQLVPLGDRKGRPYQSTDQPARPMYGGGTFLRVL